MSDLTILCTFYLNIYSGYTFCLLYSLFYVSVTPNSTIAVVVVSLGSKKEHRTFDVSTGSPKHRSSLGITHGQSVEHSSMDINTVDSTVGNIGIYGGSSTNPGFYAQVSHAIFLNLAHICINDNSIISRHLLLIPRLPSLN